MQSAASPFSQQGSPLDAAFGQLMAEHKSSDVAAASANAMDDSGALLTRYQARLAVANGGAASAAGSPLLKVA